MLGLAMAGLETTTSTRLSMRAHVASRDPPRGAPYLGGVRAAQHLSALVVLAGRIERRVVEDVEGNDLIVVLVARFPRDLGEARATHLHRDVIRRVGFVCATQTRFACRAAHITCCLRTNSGPATQPALRVLRTFSVLSTLVAL